MIAKCRNGTEFNIIIYLVLAALKGTISVGGQEKRKDRKSWKSKSKEKVGGFSSAFEFPARKRETVALGGTI